MNYSSADTITPTGCKLPDGSMGYVYSKYNVRGMISICLVVQKRFSPLPLEVCNEVAATFDDAIAGVAEALNNCDLKAAKSA